ncbi:hypothetical protein QT234_08215 [Geobacillus stearothermophilus]|nr:hypothetical protein QT234_08215 [Geobacillus stearothermophilus]WJQ05169.1 hypothetical protein QT236_08065 [Geobacillus stearothermophilus]
MKLIPPARRRRAHLSQFTTTHLHLRHPLIVAFFSFSFPGFGNFMQHRYATAFILIVWELFINTKAHVESVKTLWRTFFRFTTGVVNH